jgi:hypothetical protein
MLGLLIPDEVRRSLMTPKRWLESRNIGESQANIRKIASRKRIS